MKPNGWYSKTFCRRNFIWTPPPVVVDAAIEQLCWNFHLYPSNFQIVCILRLIAGRLRKKSLNVADDFVSKLFDEHVRAKYNFEPLIFIMILSFHCCSLWKLESLNFVRDCEGYFRRCGKTNSFWEEIFCANYLHPQGHWDSCKGIWRGSCYKTPERENHWVVCLQEEKGFDLTLKEDKGRRMFARSRDHLLIPFQC